MSSSFPKTIRLPFGKSIAVQLVPFEEILHHDSEDGAVWLVEDKVLLIDQDLSLQERKYWLLTQMHHALLDLIHEMLDAGEIAPSPPK